METNSAQASPLPKKRKVRSPVKLMANELERLASFQNFPMECPMHPVRLAQAGYNYEGIEDEVACYACHTKHKHWMLNDNPFQVHFNESESCTYVQSHEDTWSIHGHSRSGLKKGDRRDDNAEGSSCENGASGSDKENRIPTTKGNSDRIVSTSNENNNNGTSERRTSGNHVRCCNNMAKLNTSQSSVNISSCQSNTTASSTCLNTNVRNSIEPLGITVNRSRYPRQAVLAVRQSTFSHWPNQLNQNPADLAKAGLFYEGVGEGVGDCVRCFYCGGGLRDWEPDDDPWTEHARWFPKCVYLRQCKGDEFVSDIQSGLSHENNIFSKSSDNISSNVESTTTMSRDPAVLSVIEMGYSETFVLQALERFQQANVGEKATAEQILQLVFDIEEGKFGENQAENSSSNTLNMTTEDRTGKGMATNEDFTIARPLTSLPVKNGDDQIPEKINTQAKDERALLKENRDLKDQRTCKVCLDEVATIVFLPCGHLVSRVYCSVALYKCPVCRTPVRGTVKAVMM